jgi:DNA polymerase
VDIIGIDFECYWAADYSVTDLGTEAYVRDSRYETILVGIEDGPARYWLLPERFEQWVKEEVDWSDTAVVMHHAQFDGLILSHHYGVHPAMFIDTLSMARAIRGNKAGNSLKILAPIYGLGEKGDDTKWSKGKHLADFSNQELVAYGHYCAHGDVRITMGLADIFLPQFPADELALIDLTVKMFTSPVLVGDISRLRGAVSTERQRKKELLTRLGYACPVCSGTGQAPDLVSGVIPCKACAGLGIDKKPFASSDKFAAILRANGVEPETKKSPTSGEPIYAFARTDSAMQKLLDDPDEQVRLLAEARTSVKSGIVETRAQRFADMASRGPMPVYLNYCGAHTLRWSGGDGTNFQNMSNHNENRPEMAVLKQSIKAPPGHVIVCADSSQGEARLLAWCSGQDDLTEAFRAGRDVYSEHASTVYGRPIDRKNNPADKIPGHVGKVGILSFGFGSGYMKAAMEFAKGALGAKPIIFTEADMMALRIDPGPFLNNPARVNEVAAMPSRLSLNERFVHCLVTKALVDRYRARYPMITGVGLPRGKGFWQRMDAVIGHMMRGDEVTFGAHGIMTTGKEFILMPNQMKLNYRGLEWSEQVDATYFDGRSRTKIYGSLLTENLIQSLHRIIVGEQMLEIAKELRVVLMTHDEIVTVVPANDGELALQFMNKVMATTPAWATGLPLAAEGGIGETYAECKA